MRSASRLGSRMGQHHMASPASDMMSQGAQILDAQSYIYLGVPRIRTGNTETRQGVGAEMIFIGARARNELSWRLVGAPSVGNKAAPDEGEGATTCTGVCHNAPKTLQSFVAFSGLPDCGVSGSVSTMHTAWDFAVFSDPVTGKPAPQGQVSVESMAASPGVSCRRPYEDDTLSTDPGGGTPSPGGGSPSPVWPDPGPLPPPPPPLPPFPPFTVWCETVENYLVIVTPVLIDSHQQCYLEVY